jgi:hypothetical protein
LCKPIAQESPIIHTDDDRSYFQLELIIHPAFINETDQVTDHVKRLLAHIGENELSTPELMQHMGLKHRFSFRTLYLIPAIKAKMIEMIFPDKPNTENQKYKLSELGHFVLRELQKKR